VRHRTLVGCDMLIIGETLVVAGDGCGCGAVVTRDTAELDDGGVVIDDGVDTECCDVSAVAESVAAATLDGEGDEVTSDDDDLTIGWSGLLFLTGGGSSVS